MKKKIVIASVLKPIDDVRSYWKLSQSLAKTNKYEVNIIGNASKKAHPFDNITFHPHLLKRTDWLKRLSLPFLLFNKIRRIRPDLLIITTHELLWMGVLLKWCYRIKLVYDVQENDYLNLTALHSSVLKKMFAMGVWIKQRLLAPFVDWMWLAEQTYQKELHYLNDRQCVIENKATSLPASLRVQRETSGNLRLLFTGTISHYSGIDRALTTYSAFAQSQKVTLHIVGQVHDRGIKSKLEALANIDNNLQLHIASSPIPHEEILVAIGAADIGIIGYAPNKVNRFKVPTKLYEYSRYQLPFLVAKGTHWSKVGQQLGAAIPVDFGALEPNHILNIVQKMNDKEDQKYPEQATWEFESRGVIDSIKELVN